MSHFSMYRGLGHYVRWFSVGKRICRNAWTYWPEAMCEGGCGGRGENRMRKVGEVGRRGRTGGGRGSGGRVAGLVRFTTEREREREREIDRCKPALLSLICQPDIRGRYWSPTSSSAFHARAHSGAVWKSTWDGRPGRLPDSCSKLHSLIHALCI